MKRPQPMLRAFHCSRRCVPGWLGLSREFRGTPALRRATAAEGADGTSERPADCAGQRRQSGSRAPGAADVLGAEADADGVAEHAMDSRNMRGQPKLPGSVERTRIAKHLGK